MFEPTWLPPYIVDMAKLGTPKTFEAWAVTQTPEFALGRITINGKFDRYFDPETQAAWEGFRASFNLHVKYMIELHKQKVPGVRS